MAAHITRPVDLTPEVHLKDVEALTCRQAEIFDLNIVFAEVRPVERQRRLFAAAGVLQRQQEPLAVRAQPERRDAAVRPNVLTLHAPALVIAQPAVLHAGAEQYAAPRPVGQHHAAVLALIAAQRHSKRREILCVKRDALRRIAPLELLIAAAIRVVVVHDDLRLFGQVVLDVLVAQAEIAVGDVDGLIPVFIVVPQQRQLEILRSAVPRLRIAVADQLRVLRAHGHRGVDLAALVLVRDTVHIGHAFQPRPLHEVIVLPIDVVDADHVVILVIPRHGDAAVVPRPGHTHPNAVQPELLRLYQRDGPRPHGLSALVIHTKDRLVRQYSLRILRHVRAVAPGVAVSVLMDAAERHRALRRHQCDKRAHQRVIVGHSVLIIIGVEIPQIFVIREMDTRVTQLARVQSQITDGLGGLAVQSHPGVIRLAAAGRQYIQLLHQRSAVCILPRHLEDHIVAALAILHPAAHRHRNLTVALRTAAVRALPALQRIAALRRGQFCPV